MNETSRQFLADLQGKLTQYFNGEEIETLAFILGVDYDSLRGGAKPTKVNSLISDLARNGRLDLLLREARSRRTNVTWPAIPDDFELPQGATGSDADGVTIYQIQSITTGGGGIVIGDVKAGDNVDLGAKTIGGDAIKGGRYDTPGEFRGAALNVGARLDDVSRTIGAAAAIRPGQREELQRLMADLATALSGLPPRYLPAAETLARRLDALAEEATAAEPDQETLTDLGEIARRAGGSLAGVVPGIARTVAVIVEIVSSASF